MRFPNVLISTIVLISGLSFFACQRNRSGAPSLKTEAASPPSPPTEKNSTAHYTDAAVETTEAPNPQTAFQTAVAAISRWDTLKKLARTAEMRFRTPDVLQATLAIEDIARQNGGFVLENNLTQSADEQYLRLLNRDSAMETVCLQVRNTLVLRVPSAQLDTTLRSIGRWAEQLDYRRVRADDVSLQWLEEQLAARRNNQYQAALQTDLAQRKGAIDAVAGAREKALTGQSAADAARLEQLRLDDAVKLSTVKLELYQRPVIRRTIVANTEQMSDWQPALGARIAEALQNGWRGLLAVLLLALRIWPLWIAGAAVWSFLKLRHRLAVR